MDIGGWAVYPPGVELGTGPEIADFSREADARLIAALGPAAVLELVAGAEEMCEIHVLEIRHPFPTWEPDSCFACTDGGWPCPSLRATATMIGAAATDA